MAGKRKEEQEKTAGGKNNTAKETSYKGNAGEKNRKNGEVDGKNTSKRAADDKKEVGKGGGTGKKNSSDKAEGKKVPEGIVDVKLKKPSRVPLGRVILLCIVGAAMLGFAISALVTCFDPAFQEKFGGMMTKAARVADRDFSQNLNGVYGKWLCFGYFGVASVGFLLLGTLLRFHRRKLRVLFYSLFFVTAIAADALSLYFCRGQVELVAADQYQNQPEVYKLMGFIPLPTLLFGPMLLIFRGYAYAALPMLAQVLMLYVTFGLAKFKTRLYEAINVFTFLLVIAFAPILVCYLLFTIAAVIIIAVTLWALKGFFTIDTGRYVQTSDGTSLYQVDGDLYSDGNGNYYTYDGDSFR